MKLVQKYFWNAIRSPDEIINGTLTIENFGEKKIKKAKIVLLGIESGTGVSEQKVDLLHRKNLGADKRATIESYSKDIVLNNQGRTPIEFAIPANVKKSYKGKFTEYFWTLGVKIDIKLERDLYIETNIICR